MNNEHSDVLVHYGRKGQHWGVRNGPPYPLGYSDLSPEEKRKNTTIRGKIGGQYKLNRLDQKRAVYTAKTKKRLDKLKTYQNLNKGSLKEPSKAKKEAKLLSKYQKSKAKKTDTEQRLNRAILDLEKKGYSIYEKKVNRDVASFGQRYMEALVGGTAGMVAMDVARKAYGGRGTERGKLYRVKRYRNSEPAGNKKKTQYRRR